MKPIKPQEEMYHCVTDEQFIQFMEDNGFEELEHTAYRVALKNEIIPRESNNTWERTYISNKDEEDEEYTPICLYWIKKFFEVHSWVYNLRIINTDYFKN